MRGNPDNLRQAAARKSAAAQARAEQGLHEIIRRNEPITFRGLAQTAGVSLDFLYRCTPIRQRVQQLRAQQQNTPPPAAATPARDETPSSVVRTLTAQLTELKRRHRDEISALKQALEAAHGENLELRRRLGAQRAPRRHHDTLTLPLQTRTQTIYLRKHTNSRSLPQIRSRHNTYYAEVRIMPMWGGLRLVTAVTVSVRSA